MLFPKKTQNIPRYTISVWLRCAAGNSAPLIDSSLPRIPVSSFTPLKASLMDSQLSKASLSEQRGSCHCLTHLLMKGPCSGLCEPCRQCSCRILRNQAFEELCVKECLECFQASEEPIWSMMKNGQINITMFSKIHSDQKELRR